MNASEINNYYNKTYIDGQLSTINTNLNSKLDASVISNYYNKTEVDGIFNTNKHRTKTAVIEFLDVLNLGIDTMTIIGSTNIQIKRAKIQSARCYVLTGKPKVIVKNITRPARSAATPTRDNA